MPRHGVSAPRALPVALLAGVAAAGALAACADAARAPTAPAAAPDVAPSADVVDPIEALLLDTLFVAAPQKTRDAVAAAHAALAHARPGDQDCANAQFLAHLTLDALAAGALGPRPGAEDPDTPMRVNALLAWIAPRCFAGVPRGLPDAALGPNGLAVPVAPGAARTLTTRDGVLRLELPANAFAAPTVLVVTRRPSAGAGPGGGPFATTLRQYGPTFRLTTVPATTRLPGGTIDFAVALVGDRVPPSAARGHLLPIFAHSQSAGAAGALVPTLGAASALYAGSPSYLSRPTVNLPKPFSSDSAGQGGTSSGAIPTLERICADTDDCDFYRFAVVDRGARAGAPRPRVASAAVTPAAAAQAPLPFDLTLGLARIYDPAVNGRAALTASHVCGLHYTIANAGAVDLAAIFQPVNANGAPVPGTWRTTVLVPAKGSRAVRVALPAGVAPSAVAAVQLLYGPTLVRAVRPTATPCL